MTHVGQTEEPELSFLAHLIELRSRLMKAVLSVLAVFLGLLPFSQELYSWLSKPLLAHMPENSQMIAIDVASPFLTPLKLTLFVAMVIAVPVVLYQVWSFVAPGLYKHEKKLALPLLVSSTFLFYGGCIFAYYVILPIVFGFFTGAAPEGVAVMTDIARYLDFVMIIFFAFGVSFEIPIVAILLVATGVSTPKSLAAKRPYVVVGAFTIGMFLTPPDIISQTLLAIPMWLLYELGIIFSAAFKPKPVEQEHISD